jgi:hypothetical protein
MRVRGSFADQTCHLEHIVRQNPNSRGPESANSRRLTRQTPKQVHDARTAIEDWD